VSKFRLLFKTHYEYLQRKAREYRKGNKKLSSKRNWKHRVHKRKTKHNSICIGHCYSEKI